MVQDLVAPEALKDRVRGWSSFPVTVTFPATVTFPMTPSRLSWKVSLLQSKYRVGYRWFQSRRVAVHRLCGMH